MSSSLHPSLSRQLKRVGLAEEGTIPTTEVWKKFLRSINEHYHYVEEDRELLMRTSELAAEEVNQIKSRLVSHDKVLRGTLATVATTLGDLGRLAAERAEDEPGKAPPSETEILDPLASFAQAKEAAEKRFDELIRQLAAPSPETGPEETADLVEVKDNLVRLGSELVQLLDKVGEGVQRRDAIDSTRAFQEVLLPPTSPVDFPYFQIAGASRPMTECGGDFWGVYPLQGDRVLVLIGDVTGHGVPSAIVAGAAKSASAVMCSMSRGELDAAQALVHLNAAIYEVAKKHVMMTCTASVIDPNTKTLSLANAGHNFAYLIRDGATRTLIAHGPPLGAAPIAEYSVEEFPLQPNDALVWFTDGAIETENEWGEQFTEKRLRAVCQRIAKDGTVPTRDGILEVLDGFRQGQPQTDDITVVVATIKG